MSKIYLVGGAVRDQIMGKKPKDLDYLVETSDYDVAKKLIASLNCTIVQEREVYKVFRCVHPELGGIDFSMPRMDMNCDGRHADTVSVESVEEDLARRDFTMNAMALEVNMDLTKTTNLIDPFEGKKDIQNKIIKFVGDPKERIFADNLRILRALRFAITLNFEFETETKKAIQNSYVEEFVSSERIFSELNKMFEISNLKTINLLNEMNQLYLLDRIKIKTST